MTDTLVLKNRLVMPQAGTYLELEQDEMEYVDGGGNCRFSICITWSWISKSIGSVVGSVVSSAVKAIITAKMAAKAATASAKFGAVGGLKGVIIAGAIGAIVGVVIGAVVGSILETCFRKKEAIVLTILDVNVPLFPGFNLEWVWD